MNNAYRQARSLAFRRRPENERPTECYHLQTERLKTLSHALVAGGMVLAGLIAFASGVRVTAKDAWGPALIIASLLLLAATFARTASRSRLADVIATLGLGWVGGLVGTGISLAGLRLRFPIADPWLKAADAALGFDAVAMVQRLVKEGQWIFSIMAPAYAYAFQLVALSVVALILAGKRLEAWRAVFCFNGTLISSCLITAFVPAKGAGVWFDHNLVGRLPDGAATYAFSVFDRFYFSPNPELGINTVEGVVTFPSFHVIMGLIVLAMWRWNIVAMAAAATWFGFMLLSTLPYGGHYLVDLLGGTLVWVSWFALSKRVASPVKSAIREPKDTRTFGDALGDHPDRHGDGFMAQS